WVSEFAGDEAEAREPGKGQLEVLCDAPGTYVK
ncbi:MAG: Unknown protein, partial [uncultured Thiotrichaceae bacterium]